MNESDIEGFRIKAEAIVREYFSAKAQERPTANPDPRHRERSPEYRERKCARQRERYANDPEYRKHKNAKQRERYATDPEYRERENTQHRERRANPEYRERENTRAREKRANTP